MIAFGHWWKKYSAVRSWRGNGTNLLAWNGFAKIDELRFVV